mgnify:CR=1 FL=1
MKEHMQWEENQSQYDEQPKEITALNLDKLDQRIQEEPLAGEHPIFVARTTFKPPASVVKMGPMKLFPFCGKLSIFATYVLFEPTKLYPKNEATPSQLFRIDIDQITKLTIKKVGLTKNLYIEVKKSSEELAAQASNG